MASMTLRTYRAPTIGEALAQVKKELGKDAVILHTKAYRAGSILGFFGKPMVELTASVGVNVVNPLDLRRRSAAAASTLAPESTAPTPRRNPASAVARAYAAPSGVEQGAPKPGTASPAAHSASPAAAATPAASVSADFDPRVAVARANAECAGGGSLSPDLQEELAAIKCMVAQVLQSSARSAGGAGVSGSLACPSPAMPEALLKYYLRLIQNDVSREIADRVASAIRDELTPAELADDAIVRQSVLRHVESLIPADGQVAAPPAGAAGGPFVLALVGPTGVGKTTTIAKLAAAYRLRHGKRVALITSDTYRIAAVEQLRTYASIIGVPLHVAHAPEQMRECVAACADCDVVLIDTAGRSPGDTGRLDELRAFMEAARPDQVHLVLASVGSEAALMRTATQFACVGPSRVIFTKLDEAASLGVLINVATRLSAKLSFVTTGQEVPDDIEPGRADRLARLILDGCVGPATPSAAGVPGQPRRGGGVAA